ncbi:unnamed protein product [Gongylonema pulchrum]|uniref:Uncharacterized protein n=1 Tax=Gongylonema pulchrum TaxID=637853 RepID=A0A183DAE6_9BILA|nr:unnamed protein product [Gongylonema pulchrum]
MAGEKLAPELLVADNDKGMKPPFISPHRTTFWITTVAALTDCVASAALILDNETPTVTF